MIPAILSAAVVWCLFYGRLSVAVLAVFSVALGVILALLCRHKHTQFLTIDVLAQTSRLNSINPSLKAATALALMIICICAASPLVGILLVVIMLFLVVFVGGLHLHDYVQMFALPVSFLMISAFALLFEVTSIQTGVFHIHVFGVWLCVSVASQVRAALVIGRALGAVSCLYMLSLTTPMSELIGVLRRVHCPNVLISLMYLIYRYIFILLNMYHTMTDAAKSRLGYLDFRTTGAVYTNLLARSYRQANKSFDAMESRCYDTEIRFLENREKVTGAHTAVAAGLVAVTLALALILR